MTQPSTDQRASGMDADLSPDERGSDASDAKAKADAAQSNEYEPAIIHPNFDPVQTPIDPARDIYDIPEPARRHDGQLRRLYGKNNPPAQIPRSYLTASPWQLVASKPFAEHLALLQAARLIKLPKRFYERQPAKTALPLLAPLTALRILDLNDIARAAAQEPRLSRYGILPIDNDGDNQDNRDNNKSAHRNTNQQAPTFRAIIKRFDADELLSAQYADDWQVILQPQQFEDGEGSLITDIMACSVAVHALQQCKTRQSINKRYSARDICEYVRYYVLSQVTLTPAQRHAYRQIRVFSGHVIVAAIYLGWQWQVSDDGECYFNLSSRNSLLTRYANMQDYVINGWQGQS